MKKHVKLVNMLFAGIGIVCFVTGALVNFGNGFFAGKYILSIALMTEIILALTLGHVQGLVFSMLAVVIYSGLIVYQSLIGEVIALPLNYIWIAAFPMVAVMAGYAGEMIRRENDDLRECMKIKNALITKDEDTGFGNAREFYEDLKTKMSSSRRHGISMTLAIVEIQYFDELMSIYGKDSYPKIFDMMSAIFIKNTRIEDTIYRISEKTFAIIMPHTAIEGADIVKMRIKDSLVSINAFQDKKYQEYRIEARIGLAEMSEETGTEFDLKKKAEREIEFDV